MLVTFANTEADSEKQYKQTLEGNGYSLHRFSSCSSPRYRWADHHGDSSALRRLLPVSQEAGSRKRANPHHALSFLYSSILSRPAAQGDGAALIRVCLPWLVSLEAPSKHPHPTQGCRTNLLGDSKSSPIDSEKSPV